MLSLPLISLVYLLSISIASSQELETTTARKEAYGALLSAAVEAKFVQICPIVTAKDLVVELLLRKALQEPIEVEVTILLYHLHEIDDLTQSLGIFLNALFIWELPCASLNLSDIQQIEGNLDEELNGIITFTKNLADVWYPTLLHLNAVQDINFIKKITDTVRVLPLSNPPIVMANGFGMIESTCDHFSFAKFPFDTLRFALSLEPSYPSQFVVFSDQIYFRIDEWSQFLPQADIWYLSEPVHYKIINKTTAFQGRFQIAHFYVILKRKYQYYIGLIFLPVVILFVLQISALLMHPHLPDRSMFSMTVVLATSVLLSLVYSAIPQTSETVHLITIIQSEFTVCAFVTAYVLFSGSIARKKWSHEVVYQIGCLRLTVIRMMDFAIAFSSSLAVATIYAVCLSYMLD